MAATRLAKDGLMDAHDHCVKFHERVLPEAFRKLLTSNAIQRWQLEIQEGIYDMLQLFIDLILARIKTEPVPVGLLNILATVTSSIRKYNAQLRQSELFWRSGDPFSKLLSKFVSLQAFDLKNDWNHKNRDRQPRGLWRDFTASVDLPQSNVEFARPSEDTMGRKQQYQWLVELINQFGQKGGFRLVQECFQTRTLNVREMAALIAPVSKCVELLDKEHVKDSISILLEHSFSHIEKMDDSDLKSKEVTAVSDLLASLKVIGIQLWPETDHVENCDRLRLNMICRFVDDILPP